MSWSEFAAARQVLAEERVGAIQRERDRAEQAQVEQTKANIRKYAMPKSEAATPAVLPPKPITDEIIG